MEAGKTVGLLLAIILLVIMGMPIHIASAQVDTSLPETGSITAHKFNDSNSNAVQDAGEEDIEGWLIRVYKWDDTGLEMIAEERTDLSGSVTFSGLEPNRYKVWEEQVGCWQPTTPESMNNMGGGYYTVIHLDEGQNITVEFGNVLADDEAPIIDMPENVLVACGGSTHPDSTGYALANDNCDPSPVVTYADSQDGNVITRTWTASDASGNSVGYDQLLTVEDTSEPIIVCPGAITIEDGDPTGPRNTGWASATDDCSDNIDITYSDSRNQNTITRTWTATDSAGNTASCVQVITIIEPVPTYSLTITSSEGGSVTTPGEDTFGPYYYDQTVNLIAAPNTDYTFVNWTGTGASAIDDPDSASTFITMNGDYDIQANFVLNRWLQVDGMLNNCCTITIATDDSTPNDLSNGDSGVFAFPEGTTVTLSATTCIECCGEESQFSYWLVFTGASEGQYDNLSVFTDPTISLVMGEYTLAIPACSDNPLSLAKEVTPNPCLFPGEEDATVHYAIDFSFDDDEFDFDGSDTCSDAVVISDYLPDGLIPVERSISNGGIYYPDEHLVQWTAYASTGSVSFDAHILPSFTGEVAVNVAAAWVENVCTEDESPLGYHDDGQLLSLAYINTDVCTEMPALDTLTITSSEGGSVTTPGEGTFGPYYHNETIDLIATPDTDYAFVNWTGTGASAIDDPDSASTFITMNGDYDIQANFVPIQWLRVNGMLNNCCSITIATDDTTLNELSNGDSGVFAFHEGTTVTLSALACTDCCEEESRFSYWLVFTGASEGQYDSLSVFTDPTISLVMEEYTLAIPACSDNPLSLAKEVTPNPCLFPGEEDATVHYAIDFSFDDDDFDFEGSDTCSDAVVISDYLPDGLIPVERSISNGGTYYPDEHLVQWTAYASAGSVSFDAYILPSFTGEVAVNVAAAWVENVCTEDESPLGYHDDGQLLSLAYISTDDICTERPATNTVTFVAGSGGTLTGDVTQQLPDGGDCTTVTAKANTGYQFTNWIISSGEKNGSFSQLNRTALTITNVTGDTHVTANFRPISSGVSGSGVSGGGTNGGNGDDEYSVEFQSPSETTNYTLSIEVNPADSGSTDPSLGSYSYEEGTVINISATPWDGYEFLNWIGDASGTLSAITMTMDGNKSITANFQAIPLPMIQYILTMISAEGGDTDPTVGDHSFEEGSLVTITAIPKEGYTFAGWIGDVKDPDMATTTVIMDADKEISVKFSEIGSPVVFHTLTIEVNGDEGCETNPKPGSYQYKAGTVVEITANAADGWEFVEWTGTAESSIDDSSSTTTTVTIDGDYTITANFEENSSPTNWPMISGLIAALLAILIALILFILNKRKETA